MCSDKANGTKSYTSNFASIKQNEGMQNTTKITTKTARSKQNDRFTREVSTKIELQIYRRAWRLLAKATSKMHFLQHLPSGSNMGATASEKYVSQILNNRPL